MSMPPPPYQPLSYDTPQVPQPSGRPTSVTVLAIICIILGGLGVVCGPFALLPYFVQFGPPNPAIDLIKSRQALYAWTLGSSMLGILAALVLLIGSIGSLSLKPWGRMMVLFLAWYSLITTVIGSIVTFTVLVPAMSQASTDAQQAAAMARGATIGGVVGVVIGLVLPICILIFFNREHVKTAFSSADSLGFPNAGYPPGMPPPP